VGAAPPAGEEATVTETLRAVLALMVLGVAVTETVAAAVPVLEAADTVTVAELVEET
jgi:hypothetical protein